MVTPLRKAAAVVAVLAASTASPARPQTTPSTLSAIAQAAEQRGVVKCLNKIDALAKTLGENYDIGVFIFNDVTSPDSRTVSLSLELSPSPSGGAAYMSASFAPNVLSGCEVLVESVIYWASRCDAVGLAYPGYMSTGYLLNSIDVRSTQGPARLFLIPAGAGCLSIEKSVYYQ